MLNRKASNYLFYGGLVIITAVIILVRMASLGSLNDKIAAIELNNQTLQTQIDALETQVEDNKDLQIDHLYDLFGKVPNIYSTTELTYYTIAKLEEIGIDEDPETQRTVIVDANVTFPLDSIFSDIQLNDFKVVEVEVYFNTLTVDTIDSFIDVLYASEQIFIINSIEYYSPDGENYIGVTVNFLAFYDMETQ